MRRRLNHLAKAACVLLLVQAATARAEPRRIILPLSQYGSLASPELALKGLDPPVRQAVQAALAAAGEGTRRAEEAEAVERQAMTAAEKARAAARLARQGAKIHGAKAHGAKAHGILDVFFAGASCRFAGEIAVTERPQGFGVMVCGAKRFEGEFAGGKPSGVVTVQDAKSVYLGQFQDGAEGGLGGDYSLQDADAYEGGYSAGTRSGFGVERDKDGAYPGRYGFAAGAKGPMEILGLQDFKNTHWAGTYGFYTGPKIACSAIQGAVLEGSVLDGYGAKFDASGQVSEQGLYRLGRLAGSSHPPC